MVLNFGCSKENALFKDEDTTQKNFKLLSLGDSYTIGESVCEICKFPEQLKDSLKLSFEANPTFDLKVIATTGWTTTNLINTLNATTLSNDYDLTTLLIGVNNQYQNSPFSVYEIEFPELVNKAIGYAKGDKSNVIVISIPDYTFTPFGQNTSNVSSEIDEYNDYAKNYCNTNNISFINITDITRNGITDPKLVAADGLHPSEYAYSKFIERILPIAIEKLKN